MTYRKKLIEVALPLEAINLESAREKSIRHGHPSTLHLWWARRPLATCRAVLWASLVDDPSSWPDKFPTEEEQQRERQRLFDILARIEVVRDRKGNAKQVVRGLVSWDDVNDPNSGVLEAAQREIARCLAWDRGEEPPTDPKAVREYIAQYAPPVYDPFAGGGSIPLEAQRLGLEAHASDLNPVAVLINKALIEIPPKFKDQAPVNPVDCPHPPTASPRGRGRERAGLNRWYGAQGLAADVRYYGEWMRDEAFKRIGHLYPKVALTPQPPLPEGEEELEKWEISVLPHPPTPSPPSPLSPKERVGESEPSPSGKGQGEGKATVIAWLWARTVKCPNPACGCQMPLVRSFQLSTKKGKEAWVEPVIDHPHPLAPSPIKGEGTQIRFVVKSGKGRAPEGTVDRKGARCIACGTPVPLEYVRSEGRAGRMGQQLMAIVAEGQNGRVYLAPTPEQEAIANSAQPTWKPDTDLPKEALGFRVQNYGMTKHADLFTPRQLVALTTFSDLVGEAREKATQDAIAAGLPDDDVPLNEGGTGARAYGEAIATYLAFAIDKVCDYNNNICTWHIGRDAIGHLFTRQAIPMAWDFCEANPLSDSSGNFNGAVEWVSKVVEKASPTSRSQVTQHDATAPHPHDTTPKLISTDPPYYDNIGYADLSDFFYVWLRRSLQFIYPNLFGTLLTPKAQELVADNFRHGTKQKAKEFFEEGFGKTFERLNKVVHSDYPLTVYYAFKQEEDPSPPEPPSPNGHSRSVAERNGGEEDPVPLSRSRRGARGEGSRASTGWETMLEGLIKAGFSIDGTWPMRSELSNRMVASGTNALASSIVLVCRPRPADAPKITRRQFLSELKRELPRALKTLQQGNIAPVDFAQASIGPGMAVFSRYAAVLENDGTPMRVRTALELINQTLDEYLTEQEGEFDSDTRWALIWFEQHEFNEGPYGDAETLSKAKNTTVQGMVNGGILEAKGGKVRLLTREEIAKRNGKRQKRKEKREERNEPSTSLLTSPLWLITQLLIHALDKQGETGAAELLAQLGDRAIFARDLAYRLYSLCDRKRWSQEALAYNSLVSSWPEMTRLAATMQASTQINLQF
ncbi:MULTISPECIES: DUF1156 domain-containing protein [unclassified Thermosynechococcus]|uniref:DUF1156 domain-containing protein n=1 Tax=unclassified Thermosynechococcus TaxID=2622553 RepID=UPI002877A388|nr:MULTISPECIES: DUF1156 domain-containing protein [unclassified Thermosynechococcus]WNC52587.1 DUF1156 domain-containing protein [Thermosynechococcus sp. TG215]WNC57675.1 DUF1156 domain-containing protein [Thermosynechococcus sp. TG218]